MIYLVWHAGDQEQFEWFFVCSKRREAMQHAKSFSVGLKIVYLSINDKRELSDFDASKHVVVQQKANHYHGA